MAKINQDIVNKAVTKQLEEYVEKIKKSTKTRRIMEEIGKGAIRVIQQSIREYEVHPQSEHYKRTGELMKLPAYTVSSGISDVSDMMRALGTVHGKGGRFESTLELKIFADESEFKTFRTPEQNKQEYGYSYYFGTHTGLKDEPWDSAQGFLSWIDEHPRYSGWEYSSQYDKTGAHFMDKVNKWWKSSDIESKIVNQVARSFNLGKIETWW